MIRHRFFAFLPISVLALIVFVPGGTNADRDKWKCGLNASAPFGWVVMIWDHHKFANATWNGENGTATMGSLITCNSVLTTAYYYVNYVFNSEYTFDRLNGMRRFRVIGQNIYDRTGGSGLTHPCYQNNSVVDIEVHPKALIRGQRVLFDVAVIVMPRPFFKESPAFPSMHFPETTLDLILSIRYVNTIQSDTYCTMPIPKVLNVRDWVFDERIDTRNKAFHSFCLKRICQQKTSGAAKDVPECEKVLNKRLNATMLCMKPYWVQLNVIKQNPDGTLYPNGLAGTPLVCNGSTLGLSSNIKFRSTEDYREYSQDIFFVITLLRVLPWLIDQIEAHSPKINPFYVEESGLTRQIITEPSTLSTEDFGYKYFFTLEKGHQPFPPPPEPEPDSRSLAPVIFCWSIFSKILSTSLLLMAFSSTQVDLPLFFYTFSSP